MSIRSAASLSYLAPLAREHSLQLLVRAGGHAMLDSERDRIFSEWLAGHSHKGILFKVVHAYAFEHADRQDLFQDIVIQIWRSVDAFRGESFGLLMADRRQLNVNQSPR